VTWTARIAKRKENQGRDVAHGLCIRTEKIFQFTAL